METLISHLQPFSLPIFLVENAIDDEQCNFLRDFCEKQEFSDYDQYDSKDTSGRNVVQISKDLKVLDAIPQFKSYIEFLTVNISRDVLKQECEQFMVGSSWVTKTKKGDSSMFHCHKNYYMAGVLYLQDDNRINVMNPWKTFDNFLFDTTEQNPYTCHLSTINPPKNSFLLMPAYLQHAVGPWESDDTIRYSIAVNILPKQPYGGKTSAVNV